MPTVRLAVLGDPLRSTLSPQLHRAGCAAVGLECESQALRTAPDALGPRLRELERAGTLGVNLTHPLKEAALAHVARVSDAARSSRSINTIGFAAAGRWGETTDGGGFLDLLLERARDPRRERVVLLGAGGAARSLAWALVGAGATVVASARRPASVEKDAWPAGCAVLAWRSAGERRALDAATLVVNATPQSGAGEPLAAEDLPANVLAIDLTYGSEPTPWVSACRAAGRDAIDGLGLLVHQARRSLSLWLQRDVPVEPLSRAVGWPR